jgi:hypothetical protein
MATERPQSSEPGFRSHTHTPEEIAAILAKRGSKPFATASTYRLELVTHDPNDFVGIPWLTVVRQTP